jgi:hypothetical protein
LLCGSSSPSVLYCVHTAVSIALHAIAAAVIAVKQAHPKLQCSVFSAYAEHFAIVCYSANTINSPLLFYSTPTAAAAARHTIMCSQTQGAELPADISGHIVLVVNHHYRLEHFIVPLRRLRPAKPVVIVTQDAVMYYELMHRLQQLAAVEPTLDISQVYHVYGSGKHRTALEQAYAERSVLCNCHFCNCCCNCMRAVHHMVLSM